MFRIKLGVSYKLGSFLISEQYLLCCTGQEEILGGGRIHMNTVKGRKLYGE